MKKLMVFFFLLSISILNGCANVHSGEYAVPINDQASQNENALENEAFPSPQDFGNENPQLPSETPESGLIISGKLNKTFSSRYFAYIDFTFENTTSEWVRIHSCPKTKFE